jgi:hypothetical protein
MDNTIRQWKQIRCGRHNSIVNIDSSQTPEFGSENWLAVDNTIRQQKLICCCTTIRQKKLTHCRQHNLAARTGSLQFCARELISCRQHNSATKTDSLQTTQFNSDNWLDAGNTIQQRDWFAAGTKIVDENWVVADSEIVNITPFAADSQMGRGDRIVSDFASSLWPNVKLTPGFSPL